MKKNHLRVFQTAALLVLVLGTLCFSAEAIKLKVTAEVANIRIKPSISSQIIRQFPEGAILESVRQEGEWYLVRFEPDESGVTSGYVHESLVLPLEERTAAAPRAQIAEPATKKNVEKPVRTEAPAADAELPVVEEPIVPPTWAITISAGGQYAGGGDLNKGAVGLADYYGAAYGVEGGKDVKPPHFGLIYGGEVAVSLTSQLSVSVGVDYFRTSQESLVTFQGQTSVDTLTIKPMFQAIPVRVGLVYYPFSNFYAKLGFAYYFAKCGYTYRYEQDTSWKENSGDASANGLGLWGGLGYEFALSETFSLVLEVQGQYAPVKGFNGQDTSETSETTEPIVDQGKLYAYDVKLPGSPGYPLVIISSRRPSSDAYVENEREAKVDFSGAALRLGLKVRF
jgi:hypothetical protein